MTRERAAVVTFVRATADTSKFTLRKVPNRPGVAAQILQPISDAELSVDLIVQNLSADGHTDFTFTLMGPVSAADRAEKLLQPLIRQWGSELSRDDQVAKISLIGERMRSEVGVATKAFQALADQGINIEVIATSSIRITVLVSSENTQRAVSTLRKAFITD